jgi:hypothetical protein
MSLRNLWKPVAVAVLFLVLGWVVGLVVLHVWLIRRAIAFHKAQRAIAATTLCADGHEVSQFGRFTCKVCGATTDGWAWQCALCGGESGWTACPTCGLAVQNPMERA